MKTRHLLIASDKSLPSCITEENMVNQPYRRLSVAALALLFVLLSGCPTDTLPVEEEYIGALMYRSVGDLPAATSDNTGQLVYVIDEAMFYYSDGAAWVNIDLVGPAGADGVSITWKGALTTAPAGPGLNWAYYNRCLPRRV